MRCKRECEKIGEFPLFSGRWGGFAVPPYLCLPKIPGSAVRETHGLLAADLGILGGQTRVFFFGGGYWTVDGAQIMNCNLAKNNTAK